MTPPHVYFLYRLSFTASEAVGRTYIDSVVGESHVRRRHKPQNRFRNLFLFNAISRHTVLQCDQIVQFLKVLFATISFQSSPYLWQLYGATLKRITLKEETHVACRKKCPKSNDRRLILNLSNPGRQDDGRRRIHWATYGGKPYTLTRCTIVWSVRL